MYLVYILQCGDGTLYTGITTDLEDRIARHNDGSGAKYTRGRGPFRLVYSEQQPDRSTASRRENQIHRWNRAKKLALISSKKGG